MDDQSRALRQRVLFLLPLLLCLAFLYLLAGISPTQAAAVPAAEPARAGVESAPPQEGEDATTRIVRAYFTERQMVHDLASWKEPWELHYDKGYLIVDVTVEEYDRLLAAGFRLEVDEALTAEINRLRLPLPNQGGGIPGFPCYRTVEETFATAQQIVADYPTLATWSDVGNSWEKTQNPANGYDMRVLRLTNGATPAPKPKFFVTSAIHAREYTTAELATRFAEFLVQNYGVDPDVTWIL
ncbi:MAG: M14 family zinc carboxypeptidase, partial [Ardenticatenaceae bacterium]